MSVLEEIRYTHSLQQNSVTREMVAEEFATIESDFDKGYALDQIIGHLELDKKQGQESFPLWTAWRVIRAINADSYGLRD